MWSDCGGDSGSQNNHAFSFVPLKQVEILCYCGRQQQNDGGYASQKMVGWLLGLFALDGSSQYNSCTFRTEIHQIIIYQAMHSNCLSHSSHFASFLGLLLLVSAASSAILLGGSQNCPQGQMDPSLELAVNETLNCLAMEENGTIPCPVIKQLNGTDSVYVCDDFISCQYRIVSGVIYTLRYNTTAGIIEYEAYVRFWLKQPTQQIQIIKAKLLKPQPTGGVCQKPEPLEKPTNATTPLTSSKAP